MAIDKKTNPNIDNSDLVNFPNGRIKDNTGTGNGTPVNKEVYSDLHEFFAKLMRMAAITYNGLPDSEGTGYQLVDALIALAGKNDMLTSVSTINTPVSGTPTDVLYIPQKLNILKTDELLILKAANNYTAETLIKGTGTLLLSCSVPSPFKTGDYLRMIRTTSGVTLIRLADAGNINTLVAEKSYLKAATDLEELTGTSTAKATTPASNLAAFTDRVNGDSSDAFIATTGQNGLLSKEDKAIIDDFVNPVKNVGWFSGVDPGGDTVGTSFAHSGDVSSAVVQSIGTTPSADFILVTMANPMSNTNYYVRLFVESEGTLAFDNDILAPVFKKVSTTQFLVGIQEQYPTTQSLKIHIEAVQLT